MIAGNDFLQLGKSVFPVTCIVAVQAPLCVQVIPDQWGSVSFPDSPFRKTSCRSLVIFDAVIGDKFNTHFRARIPHGANPVPLYSGMFLGARNLRIIIGNAPVILAVNHQGVNPGFPEKVFIFLNIHLPKRNNRRLRGVMVNQITASGFFVSVAHGELLVNGIG